MGIVPDEQAEGISMNYRSVWIPAMACLFSHSCSRDAEQRLLAVGGIHVFERQMPCRLTRAKPEGAVEDLAWIDSLALEGKSEGSAEVRCGSDRVYSRSRHRHAWKSR